MHNKQPEWHPCSKNVIVCERGEANRYDSHFIMIRAPRNAIVIDSLLSGQCIVQSSLHSCPEKQTTYLNEELETGKGLGIKSVLARQEPQTRKLRPAEQEREVQRFATGFIKMTMPVAK